MKEKYCKEIIHINNSILYKKNTLIMLHMGFGFLSTKFT